MLSRRNKSNKKQGNTITGPPDPLVSNWDCGQSMEKKNTFASLEPN